MQRNGCGFRATPNEERHVEDPGTLNLVQCAPNSDTVNLMGKVVHVRDVPDEVHDKLVGLAEDQGLSLSAFMRREMEHVALRAEAAHRNTEVVRAARKKIRSRVPTDEVVAAVHAGRE